MSYFPVICLTCGYPIGDVNELYTYMKNKKINALIEEKDILASNITISSTADIETGDILDALNITNICCRTECITMMNWSDYMMNPNPEQHGRKF